MKIIDVINIVARRVADGGERIGKTIENCEQCGAAVTLAPSSEEFRVDHPQTECHVICWQCFERVATEDDEVIPLSEAQLDEIRAKFLGECSYKYRN